MVRMNVDDAARDFAALIDRVVRDGESVEIERDGRVVARMMPETPKRTLTIAELPAFLRSLPDLGDDAEAFARDVEEVRHNQLPVRDPWAE